MANSAVWSDGYVTDTLYTDNIYREQSPCWINHVAALNGCHTRPLDAPFTYLELGCALGHSLTLFAASFPQGQFVGVDFNPAHIDQAQRRAAEYGVTNVTFIEASFQDLAADLAGQGMARALGQYDFITLHGIYSWITPEARMAVQRLIFDRLKPGGLVYNSYNAMPGWALEAPLQRLMAEFADGQIGDSGQRASASVRRIGEMAALKTGYFAQQSRAAAAVAVMARRSPNYLAHEYLNGSWNAFYSADVAEDMAAAKLDFVGSATLLDNHVDLLFPSSTAAFLNREVDPRRRQLLQDFLVNQKFRRDVFVRGHARLASSERQRLFDRQILVAAKSVAKMGPLVQLPSGPFTLEAEAVSIFKDLLAKGAASRAELGAAFAQAGGTAKDISKILTALTVAGPLIPAARAHEVATDKAEADAAVPTQRLTSEINKRVLAACLGRAVPANLASDISGNAVKLTFAEALLLDLVAREGGSTGALADRLAKEMAGRGTRPARNGQAITKPDELASYFKAQAETFIGEALPTLQRLGIVRKRPESKPR